MWIRCLYWWPVICSQNSCSTYLLFRWGRYMTCRRTHGLRLKGPNKIHPVTTHLIYYPTLPGTLKTLILVRASGCSVPLSLLAWPSTPLSFQITRESELGLFDTKYMVSLKTTSNSSNTHGVCKNATLFKEEIGGGKMHSACWISELSQNRNHHVCPFLMIWQSV